MFNLINKVLGVKNKAETVQSNTDKEFKIKIAACVVLVEVAESDSECTKDEIDHVLETMKSIFNLSREHAEEMIELAREARNKSVDLWQFTNQINQSFTHSEKIKLLEAVWQVIYADGRIDKYEDYFVHKLVSLLGLKHRELIDAKIKTKKDKSE